MLDPSRIAPALDQIDPQSRALIELFYRRGLPEAYIEEMLGISSGDLTARRMGAELEFAAELGVGLGEVQEGLPQLPEDAWVAAPPPPPRRAVTSQDTDGDIYFDEAPLSEVDPVYAPPLPASELEPLPDDPPAGDGDDGGGSSGIGRWVAALVAGIAIAVIVVIVIAANGGDDDSKKSATTKSTATETTAKTTASEPAATETTPTETTPAPTTGPVVDLQRLNGTNGKGTAQLSLADSPPRVRLKVRDFLEPQGGGYAVWVYNSPEDSKLLQATEQTDFDVSLPLPADYKRYRFVDVSREADSNPGHMGLSLLRASFADLEAK